MLKVSEDLVAAVLADDSWSDTRVDVLSLKPDMTMQEAYALQFEQMRRRVEAGDRVVGYKAAATSRSARAILPGLPAPTVGTLLASNLAHSGAHYRIKPGDTYVEAEIAIVLESAVAGPHVNQLDVARAAGWLCPAIEIAPWSPAMVAKKRSHQHAIATQKTDGLIVLGEPLPFSTVPDLRLEGALLEINGEIIGSGTGAEAMGNPLEVVARVARQLAEHDLGLEPGMVIMTGSLLSPFVLPGHGVDAHARFTSLGSVTAAFTTE